MECAFGVIEGMIPTTRGRNADCWQVETAAAEGQCSQLC